MQIAAVLATVLPLWESREVLVRILVQAMTCNKASPESMQKFGSFMGKPGVPRVRVSSPTTWFIPCRKAWPASKCQACLSLGVCAPDMHPAAAQDGRMHSSAAGCHGLQQISLMH